MISLLVLVCMLLFGYGMSLAWRIYQIDNGFAQSFHFLDRHDVVGFTYCFLVGAHVPYGFGLSYQFMEPWLDKHSRSPVTAWVELLVMEPLAGKMLQSPWWVELLVLEALVGQTLQSLLPVLEALVGTKTLEPQTTWIEIDLVTVSDV